MRNRFRSIVLPLVLLLLVLCLLLFLMFRALGAIHARREPPSAAFSPALADTVPDPSGLAQPVPEASAPPAPESEEATLPSAIEEYAVTAAREAYEVAELYQALYNSLYSGGGFLLGSQDAERILALLGEGGYVATDINRKVPMVNQELLADFLSSPDTGGNRSLAIYQVCLDAGFLCHTLHCCEGEYYLTRTRLAWLSSSSSGLQGSTATVTYSNSYRLTALSLAGDDLYYDYTVPNNPPGTNHDGHIDTETYIYIGS